MGVNHVTRTASLSLLILSLAVSSTLATEFYLCPPTNEAVIQESPCPTACYEDSQCQANSTSSLCCPTTNCDQQCVQAFLVPYHPSIPSCPELDPDIVGLCSEFCSGDSDCDSGQRCCSNGCGHACTTVTPVCQAIVESHNGTARPGEYIPQCEDDGSFSPAQLHGSTGYGWCVRPDTGEPVGRGTVRFSKPECNNCSYKGEVYYPGDSFPNDCNTCWCGEDGSVACTEIGCNVGEVAFFSCPVLDDDTVGACSEECGSDSDCNPSQKCCSNGCGHTCMDPVKIPFVPPPRECPSHYDSIMCDVQECSDTCSDPRKICCQNTCGSRVCVTGEPPSYPCTTVVNSMTGGALLGAYIPQCNDEDGTFRALQCASHYCWCVDPNTGEPSSDMKENSHINELECGDFCLYEGEIYNDGDVVEYYTGCSKKKCIGGELVVTDKCDDCEEDGKRYHHGQHVFDCYCECWDGSVVCERSLDDDCEEPDALLTDGTEWWHFFIIGAGGLIVLLSIIAITLLVVVIVVIRNSRYRHKRLETSEILSLDTEMQVLFKNGPPEGESVELKVPIDDDDNKDDPTKA